MSTETDTSKAAIALADSYCAKAERLRIHRQELSHGDKRTEIFNTEREYLRQADRLYALSITIMGSEADDAIKALNSASKRILEFVKLVRDIERLLSVSAAILAIGVAVQSGAAPAIFAAIKVFVDAARTPEKQAELIGAQTLAELNQLERDNEESLRLHGF